MTVARRRRRPRPSSAASACASSTSPPRCRAAIASARTEAWSDCTLGSAPARLLCLLRTRLAALGSSALPGRGRPTERVATASGARVSRLQSHRCHRL
eukprot:scaffold5628_cov53-Phaeocystis_antarctica.AAC.2